MAPPSSWLSALLLGQPGSERIGSVPIEGVPPSVIPACRARVSVSGSVLHVFEGDACLTWAPVTKATRAERYTFIITDPDGQVTQIVVCKEHGIWLYSQDPAEKLPSGSNDRQIASEADGPVPWPYRHCRTWGERSSGAGAVSDGPGRQLRRRGSSSGRRP